MQQVFDVMLMERRPDLYVEARPWREFLHQAFAENRPYDVLVRQILAADGTDPARRPCGPVPARLGKATRTSSPATSAGFSWAWICSAASATTTL